ncbi:DUF6520 family protein [Flavobacterium capsici]|uniref:DUF6520 family protein n=1 Tax=Flavobacterium capsici TaxID=3075618 RepID=A0AA96EY84_9FLAO|nr:MULTISPECIES: DUF6520 family protein [unclassified Flavobacterium]WNM19478.1 DUF6520 family protein [Flavobacterium sp. PMR2A8]WNM20867.1 DUF6520 family protein [Flavobacterium sp. PMTSA4]
MKLKFIKLFMLPVAAFFLASAAAVTTDQSHQSKATALTMQGFIHNPSATDCEPVNDIDCVVGTGDPCELGSWTVYGTTGIGCSLQLKRE